MPCLLILPGLRVLVIHQGFQKKYSRSFNTTLLLLSTREYAFLEKIVLSTASFNWFDFQSMILLQEMLWYIANVIGVLLYFIVHVWWQHLTLQQHRCNALHKCRTPKNKVSFWKHRSQLLLRYTIKYESIPPVDTLLCTTSFSSHLQNK